MNRPQIVWLSFVAGISESLFSHLIVTGLAGRGGCSQAVRGCVLTFPACWGQLFLSGGASRTVHSSLLLSGECWWASICLPGGQDKPLNQWAPGNEPGANGTACSSEFWLLVVTWLCSMWLLMRGAWFRWGGLNDNGLHCETRRSTQVTVRPSRLCQCFQSQCLYFLFGLGRTCDCYLFLGYFHERSDSIFEMKS